MTTISVLKNKSLRRRLLPFSFEDRIELAAEVRVPATYDEYVEYVHDCDYRLHYHNGHIVSFIEYDEETDSTFGVATPTHEQLVARMIFLLGQALDYQMEEAHYALYASNIKIFIPQSNQSYKPDMAVAIKPIQYIEHKPKKRSITSLTSPYIVVEILSNSTNDFDLHEKLPYYQSIESLHQIIYIASNEAFVTTFIRQTNGNWYKIDFKNEDDTLPVVDKGVIKLNDIYQKIDF